MGKLEKIFLSYIMAGSIAYTTGYFSEKYIILMVGVLGLLSLIIGVYRLKYGKIDLGVNTTNILIGIFVISYLISSVINKGYSFRELIWIYIGIVCVAIIGSSIIKENPENQIRYLFTSFNFISFVSAIFGLYCYITKYSIWTSNGSRYGYTDDFISGNAILSIMSNPNTYALLCALAIITSIILLFMYNNKIIKGAFIINIIIQCICMLLTGSRNAMLMLIIFGLMYMIIFYNSKCKKYIIFGLLISGVIFLVLLYTGIISSDITIIKKISEGGFTSGRVSIWSHALNAIKDNFIFGVGIRNGITTIGQYMGNPENVLGAHNGYLSVLLANGAIVFMTICAMIINYLYKATISLGNSKVIRLMICAIISVLFANIPESLLWGDYNFVVTLLWIMLIVVANLNGNTKLKRYRNDGANIA